MVCFQDTGSLLAWSGLAISLLGYASAAFVTAYNWMVCMISITISNMAYNLGRAYKPDTFTGTLANMAIWEIGLTFIFLLVSLCAQGTSTMATIIMLAGVVFLVSPMVAHNSHLLEQWLDDHLSGIPPWLGVGIFLAVLVLIIVCAMASMVWDTMGHVIRAVLSSLYLSVSITMLMIERSYKEVCCGEQDKQDQCPLGIVGNYTGFASFVCALGCMSLLIYQVETRPERRLKAKQAKYDRLRQERDHAHPVAK